MNQPPHSRQPTALEAYFFALVVLIALVSLASVTLLSLGSFTPALVAGGAILSLLCSAVFLKRSHPSGKLGRPEWWVIALTVGAFALRANTAINVYGGQDPGVYTNVASYFAKHGTLLIKDELLDDLKDRPDLREYYLKNSIRPTTKNAQGLWYGNMLPGIYVKDLDANEWVSQFYHVNTVWLAIGEWIFGTEWKGLTLALLSSLTVIAAYLIAQQVSLSPMVGVAAAFLLATNAAHSYIGAAPVSEAVAGFFFMSAVAMLTAGRQITSILPLSALFFTRITGFLTAPVLLISLAWSVVKRKDTRAVWTGLGIIGAYGCSVLWGLEFSRPYSQDIYRGKLGIPSHLLEHVPATFVALGAAWLIVCYLALRCRPVLTPLCRLLLRHRTRLTVIAIALILAAIGFRGYLLAFTDHYAQSRWLGAKWNIAAHGFKSLKYLSLYSLGIMLSPIGLLAFLIGLFQIGKLAFTRAMFAPLAICCFGFFAALTVKQLTTPYLYYFGRYLISELLPLAIVCAAIAIHSLTRYMPRYKGIVVAAYCLCVFILLYPALSARLKLREGVQFFEAMSCIDEVTPGRSVVLIDKNGFPETSVVTALRFSFGKPTFAFRSGHFGEPGKLKDLIAFFQSKGFEVYLLSTSDSWGSREGFSKVMRIPTIMRGISSRASPPTRVQSIRGVVHVYSLKPQSELPDICQKAGQYTK